MISDLYIYQFYSTVYSYTRIIASLWLSMVFLWVFVWFFNGLISNFRTAATSFRWTRWSSEAAPKTWVPARQTDPGDEDLKGRPPCFFGDELTNQKWLKIHGISPVKIYGKLRWKMLKNDNLTLKSQGFQQISKNGTWVCLKIWYSHSSWDSGDD